MQIYHNSDACWNLAKKIGTKSKSKNKKYKNGKSAKKEYKCRSKSKQRVIPLKPRKSPGGKKNKATTPTPTLTPSQSLPTAPNKKLSEKNQQFLKGLGLKVKQTVENC